GTHDTSQVVPDGHRAVGQGSGRQARPMQRSPDAHCAVLLQGVPSWPLPPGPAEMGPSAPPSTPPRDVMRADSQLATPNIRSTIAPNRPIAIPCPPGIRFTVPPRRKVRNKKASHGPGAPRCITILIHGVMTPARTPNRVADRVVKVPLEVGSPTQHSCGTVYSLVEDPLTSARTPDVRPVRSAGVTAQLRT